MSVFKGPALLKECIAFLVYITHFRFTPSSVLLFLNPTAVRAEGTGARRIRPRFDIVFIFIFLVLEQGQSSHRAMLNAHQFSLGM